ncbi:hypothetical protein CDAR_434531 [Caerostris darwini]|uniref:Uncharacterized protein n=1 Tax=Caerostris darwini TaxID=1538125 RepID=A0AAV4PJG6_9ARAC|nr:hypothetical protein CDAR_434531 [Caerostris darwini]
MGWCPTRVAVRNIPCRNILARVTPAHFNDTVPSGVCNGEEEKRSLLAWVGGAKRALKGRPTRPPIKGAAAQRSPLTQYDTEFAPEKLDLLTVVMTLSTEQIP